MDNFENSRTVYCHSELIKIALLFFEIPSHSANAECIFLLMQVQWIKERSSLNVKTGKLFVQYNYKHLSCKEFHGYLKKNQQLLTKIWSTEKHAWHSKMWNFHIMS
jgi:hypothetical protein